jgi:hypothetical protein
MALSNISGRTLGKIWWSSSQASSVTDGYCEPSAEKTSIGRTGVNITSGI